MMFLPLRRLTSLLTASALIATFAVATGPAAALAAAPPAPYANGFENPGDAITGVTPDSEAMFDVTRVSSGTDGIPAASGSWYAKAPFNDGSLSQFTRLGGFSSTFPSGGYRTSIAIYLDMSVATGNDVRFDWSSAISDQSGNHLRDFIFNVGTDPSAAHQFVMSASNNAPGWPANPDRTPLTVSTSGWYTFQHTFRDNGSGILAVDMKVLSPANVVLATWTLSDPTDVIATTVGGNRYGWLVDNAFSSLALDTVTRSGTSLGVCPVTISGANPTVYTLLADCTTDQTIVVPQNTGGSTFDGNAHTITGIDPAGGHFLGAVVQAHAGGAKITVKNLTVTVAGLTDACDAGADRLAGIRFDGVGGSVLNNHVNDIEQGASGQSGCQEGNAIDVRNAPFTNAGPDLAVSITGNTVTDYQKTGILANGSVAATITGNTVTGDGPISYIAQNGIQVGFGATATVKGNSASGNWYTPASDIACGFLIYQADGVNASSNNFFNNERNQCNFGKGGGTFKPVNP